MSESDAPPAAAPATVPGRIESSGGLVAEQKAQSEPAADGRKVIRIGSLDLIVASPSSAVEQVTQIAQRHGGYVVQSQISGRQQSESGAVTIRVPAAQFDAVRQELKSLAKSVESENTSADDVTMRFTENEATLRNYRAEEASYVEIMKHSGRIKDTLEVAQQLSDARGRIERLQAEIRTMAMQSEMTAISITLRAEPVVVTGNRWRPLYELKAAWNDGLDALTDYTTAMMAFVLRLPAVLAWGITLILGAKLSWSLLKRIARLFVVNKPADGTVA